LTPTRLKKIAPEKIRVAMAAKDQAEIRNRKSLDYSRVQES
jgi:hypothetical protein